MANAFDLSLRGGQRPTWQSREGTHADRTRHCRGAACRARRRTYSPYKPPSKWQTLPICHCEEANGRRGALSAKREEVPLGCNLGKAVTISPITFLGSGRVLRDCHVASLLAMTHQGSAVVHQRSPAVELLPTGRSLSAATVKFGSDRVRRHSVYIGSAFPRLPRRFAPRNDKSENLAPLNLCHDHCRSAWRSLSAATDAIGSYVLIGSLCKL